MATSIIKGTHFETILTEFNRQVEITPDKAAVIEENRVLTYRDLQIQSRALSKQLKTDKNPIVAILLPGGMDNILSVLAVLDSSKAYSPLSVDYPSVKLEMMLLDIGNPLLITTTCIIKAIGLTYENIFFLDADNEIPTDDQDAKESTSVIVGNATAAVYFTSGSTGIPKPCLVGSKALVHMSKTGAERFEFKSTDESLCILNPAFVLSMYDTLMSLLSGATIRVPPNNLRYDISKLRKWIKSVGSTSIITMVSSVGEAFFNAEAEDFPQTLRAIVLAGEKLQTRPSAKIPFTVYNVYGSTESLSNSSTVVGPVSPLKNSITHTIAGHAFPGIEIYILDEGTQKPVANGEMGEIAIGGPCVSLGYLGRSVETKEKFVEIENGVRVCRMGDLGYFLPDGNLVVLNRRDNQIKVSGYRFDLSDLESALLQHICVEKAVAVLEKGKDLKFHLFYSLKSSETEASVSELKIKEFLQDRLPHYAFPHSITQVDQFPRNGNGKIDKQALLLTRSKEPKIIVATSTGAEKKLVEVWSEILQIPTEQISCTDNFFSLGGSSITAAKVVATLKQFGFQVEIFNILKIPVLNNLAGFLEQTSQWIPEGIKDFDAELNTFSLNFEQLGKLTPFVYNEDAKAILITGATGYLGGALLVELLAQTEAEIFCLIRSQSPAEARTRLEEHLRTFSADVDFKAMQRVHCIPGNLSVPYLGLSESNYNSLASSIDQVYHCAAEVHWLKRYEELRASNVLGTLEIIKFASTQKLKFLHYISTVGVLGMNEERQELETRDVVGNVQNEMGYTQSKWVAEKLVWKAIDAGIPGIVYRPGIIGSHSELGIFNSKDFITLLLQACQTVGAYPDLPWKFPYGTLEFTTSSILAISKNLPINSLKAFHLFQSVLSFESFYEFFKNNGIKKASISDWKELVLSVEHESPKSHALGMIGLFLSVPYYQNLTFFELPYAELEMKISNCETIKALNFAEPKIKLKDENGLRSLTFVTSIFRQ